MKRDTDTLILARLRVYDDLAETTFIVELEDVVKLMEGPSKPGEHRATIVGLMNEHLLDRYPHITGQSAQELSVGIEDYADLKIEVAQKLLLHLTESNGPVN